VPIRRRRCCAASQNNECVNPGMPFFGQPMMTIYVVPGTERLANVKGWKPEQRVVFSYP
jgi:hypothetical protein